MTTARLYECHADGIVIERVEITDESGALRYIRTNPSNANVVLEDRDATESEAAVFVAATVATPLNVTLAADAAALPQQANSRIEAVRLILAKADADITQPELKTLILLIARYLFHKWLGGWR